ncbi:MAG: hypothetical protein AAGC79_07025 [Pseudomonadota bacterium]
MVYAIVLIASKAQAEAGFGDVSGVAEEVDDRGLGEDLLGEVDMAVERENQAAFGARLKLAQQIRNKRPAREVQIQREIGVQAEVVLTQRLTVDHPVPIPENPNEIKQIVVLPRAMKRGMTSQHQPENRGARTQCTKEDDRVLQVHLLPIVGPFYRAQITAKR